MQSRPGPMTRADLAAIIDHQINASVLYEDSELAKIRRAARRYYDGEVTLAGDVPPIEHRSSVVSRDVADTHGWIMPQMMRIFFGSDRVVVYQARRQEMEKAAAEATDYINYMFLTECNGYRVGHDAIWDALLYGNGLFKHWWDETPEYEVKSYYGKTQLEYLDIVADPDSEEEIEHAERSDLDFTPDPDDVAWADAPIVPMLHDVKVKRRVSKGRLRLAVVPGEEFRIDPEATMLDEEHVRFCAHVTTVTRSSLIADGHPRSIVDDLPAHTSDAVSRYRKDSIGAGDTAPDRSTDLIEKWECYLQVDYDGDGVAEWRRVIVVAGAANERHVFVNEEWDGGLPFTDIVPDPRPHQWRGGSLYEEVGDIQRIKTTLWRGINDNFYSQNYPQRVLIKGAIDNGSMDEVHAPTFNGEIWVTRPDAISPLPIPFVADKLLAGMDLADRVREMRTGVSAATMSLDPEALQNQTATAVNAGLTMSQSRNELRARNIADGFRRFFGCILKLVVRNQTAPRKIKLRGAWVEMNPSAWDDDMDVVINVGLGSGSRDRDLMMMNAVLGEMKQAIAGLGGPLNAAKLGLGPDKYFDACRKLVEAAGFRSPEAYFPEITSRDVERVVQEMGAQPDPKAQEVQAKIAAMQAEGQARIQIEQAKLAADQQAKQQQAALDWQHSQAQAVIDNQHRADEIRAKAAAALEEIRLKHQLASEQAARDFQLKIEEMQINARLKERELELEADLKREQMAQQPQTAPNIEEADA